MQLAAGILKAFPAAPFLFLRLTDGFFQSKMLLQNGVQVVRYGDLVFSQDQFAFRRNRLVLLTHAGIAEEEQNREDTADPRRQNQRQFHRDPVESRGKNREKGAENRREQTGTSFRLFFLHGFQSGAVFFDFCPKLPAGPIPKLTATQCVPCPGYLSQRRVMAVTALLYQGAPVSQTIQCIRALPSPGFGNLLLQGAAFLPDLRQTAFHLLNAADGGLHLIEELF